MKGFMTHEIKGGKIVVELKTSFTSVVEFLGWHAKMEALLGDASPQPSTTPAPAAPAPSKPQKPTPAGRKGKGKRPPMSEEAKRKAAATRARKKAEREAMEAAGEADDPRELSDAQIARMRAAFKDDDGDYDE